MVNAFGCTPKVNRATNSPCKIKLEIVYIYVNLRLSVSGKDKGS